MSMEISNLYLWLNAAALSVPLLLSFDGKVRFFRTWRYLLPAILLVGIPFVAWDIHFTQSGYWGFNDRYLSGIEFFGLPLAEVLFFVTVPYSCTFIYACLKAYFGNRINELRLDPVLYIIIASALLLNVVHMGNPYTLSATLLAALIAAALLYYRPAYLNHLIAAFVVSIIPFLLMNGILTGSMIAEEIVWYNSAAFSGWRVLTIPVEDLFYSFSLISLVIVVQELLRKRYPAKTGGSAIVNRPAVKKSPARSLG
jgi:lycopene cyclase domain-containing protein